MQDPIKWTFWTKKSELLEPHLLNFQRKKKKKVCPLCALKWTLLQIWGGVCPGLSHPTPPPTHPPLAMGLKYEVYILQHKSELSEPHPLFLNSPAKNPIFNWPTLCLKEDLFADFVVVFAHLPPTPTHPRSLWALSMRSTFYNIRVVVPTAIWSEKNVPLVWSGWLDFNF